MATLNALAGLVRPQSTAAGAPSNPNSTDSSSSAAQQMGATQFLKLLTTELQNQDPLKPVDDTQSVAQLAQFSALSATQELNTSFQNFQSNFGVMQASSLIGKKVTVVTSNGSANSNSSNVTGTVNSIAVQNGQPYFTMTGSDGKVLSDSNGKPLLFGTSEIVGIGG